MAFLMKRILPKLPSVVRPFIKKVVSRLAGSVTSRELLGDAAKDGCGIACKLKRLVKTQLPKLLKRVMLSPTFTKYAKKAVSMVYLKIVRSLTPKNAKDNFASFRSSAQVAQNVCGYLRAAEGRGTGPGAVITYAAADHIKEMGGVRMRAFDLGPTLAFYLIQERKKGSSGSADSHYRNEYQFINKVHNHGSGWSKDPMSRKSAYSVRLAMERGEWIKTGARSTPLQKRLKCAARVTMLMKTCSTCCCSEGLVGGNIGLQLARGSQRDCAAWFAVKDVALRFTNAVFRGVSMVWQYSRVCWRID